MNKKKSSGKKTIVFYHANCLDGFAGAWAAWRVFGQKAEYRALKHEAQGAPRGIAGHDIFFIDYCFGPVRMRSIKKQARSLTIIDHHISHQDVVAVADRTVFSITKSGCALAWEFFHPNKKIPELLLTIQDNDLFTLKRPHTLEYAASLFLADFDFMSWDRLVKQFETSSKRKELGILGSNLLRYKEKYVSRLLEIAQPVIFHGVRAYAVNTDIFYSEAGVRIYKTLGVSLGIAWYYKDGKIKVSLRTDGTVDAARLAQRYGGGGHVGAAAFWADSDATFPWKRHTPAPRHSQTRSV
ncbi:hypothetical protein HY732_03655 [Candidatus Uhrbacteria bacterium]|nr:hypothetical protein [Candidatus Uhrbacteria bacterium]